MYRLANARVRPFPFPHFFVEEIFPPDFFARLQSHLPPLEAYQPISEGGRVSSADGNPYPERFIIHFGSERFRSMGEEYRAVWSELSDWLLGENFQRFVLSMFEGLLRQRFRDSLGSPEFKSTAQLVRDFTNYNLGPHSDHPSKVAVILFYLPETAANEHLGTSIYLAHDPAKHDDTGKHFSRNDFSLAATMPYRPNCAMGFFKTPHSFHGVERVTGPDEQRDLIQFAISHRIAAP